MNIKTVLKSSVAVAALFAVAAPVAHAAGGDATLKSGNKNSLTISGQVVRAIFHADDGVSDETFQTGGDWTQSRVRWIASGKMSENVSVGAMIEMNIPVSNEPGAMTLGTHAQDGVSSSDGGWDIRQEYVWVSHKKMGKLRLGQSDGAANGTSEADLSGTGIFARSDADSYGSGILFMNTATASAPVASTVSVSAAMTNLDANSRDDVIRYDSPKFAGASLALSVTGDGIGEVGLRYSGKFGPVKVKAAAGYVDYSSSGAASTNFNAAGSISLLHDSGLNVTFAGGKQNFDGPPSKILATDLKTPEDPSFFYWSIGYNAKIFGVGGTAFNFGMNTTNDLIQTANHDDSEGQQIHFQVVQKFSAIGAQIGLEYAKYEYDSKSNTVANTFDDIDVITFMTVFAF